SVSHKAKIIRSRPVGSREGISLSTFGLNFSGNSYVSPMAASRKTFPCTLPFPWPTHTGHKSDRQPNTNNANLHLMVPPESPVPRQTYSAFASFFPAGFFFSLSSTAATTSGKPTVASTNTSPNFPPSAGGTNLPQETASL